MKDFKIKRISNKKVELTYLPYGIKCKFDTHSNIVEYVIQLSKVKDWIRDYLIPIVEFINICPYTILYENNIIKLKEDQLGFEIKGNFFNVYPILYDQRHKIKTELKGKLPLGHAIKVIQFEKNNPRIWFKDLCKADHLLTIDRMFKLHLLTL